MSRKTNRDYVKKTQRPMVEDELSLPFDRVSLEMIYCGLYYFHSASTRGEANDPVQYFANPENQKILGIVKRQ